MPKKTLKPSEIIAGSLKLFGKEGEHWIAGDLDDGQGSYCAVGALTKTATGSCHYMLNATPELNTAAKLVATEAGVDLYHIPRWNDGYYENGYYPPTFSQIKTAFCNALKKALINEASAEPKPKVMQRKRTAAKRRKR